MMPAMNDLHAAEMAQMQARLKRAMDEKETYVRLTACLARAIVTGAKVPLLDGQVVVKAAPFLAAPTTWTVDVQPVKLKASPDTPGAADENALVVVVKDKQEAPRLVVANGAV